MPVLHLTTQIEAPPDRVFDLARSIGAHLASTADTEEQAIGGVTSGLIGLDQEVTWEARHFGIRQRLTVRITGFERPHRFQDTMIAGAFRRMVHDHEFRVEGAGTLMVDRFEFASPLGWLGAVFDRLVLSRYLRRFLLRRNQTLKALAESGDFQKYLGAH